jgi:hypothetical protein
LVAGGVGVEAVAGEEGIFGVFEGSVGGIVAEGDAGGFNFAEFLAVD